MIGASGDNVQSGVPAGDSGARGVRDKMKALHKNFLCQYPDLPGLGWLAKNLGGYVPPVPQWFRRLWKILQPRLTRSLYCRSGHVSRIL